MKNIFALVLFSFFILKNVFCSNLAFEELTYSKFFKEQPAQKVLFKGFDFESVEQMSLEKKAAHKQWDPQSLDKINARIVSILDLSAKGSVRTGSYTSQSMHQHFYSSFPKGADEEQRAFAAILGKWMISGSIISPDSIFTASGNSIGVVYRVPQANVFAAWKDDMHTYGLRMQIENNYDPEKLFYEHGAYYMSSPQVCLTECKGAVKSNPQHPLFNNAEEDFKMGKNGYFMGLNFNEVCFVPKTEQSEISLAGFFINDLENQTVDPEVAQFALSVAQKNKLPVYSARVLKEKGWIPVNEKLEPLQH